jgi:hypothetical protein
MSETIISIKPTNIMRKDRWPHMKPMGGFTIQTNKQDISILIDSERSCCEEFGMLTSQDTFDDFIGAEILSIERVDDALVVYPVLLEFCEYLRARTVFININTTAGTLQFTAYNSHNGYYGHDVLVESEQLKVETDI